MLHSAYKSATLAIDLFMLFCSFSSHSGAGNCPTGSYAEADHPSRILYKDSAFLLKRILNIVNVAIVS